MPPTYTDPKDTPVYLAQNGWERAEFDEETIWIGFYECETTTMEGVLRRTPSGDRKFYARNPTDSFIDAAHEGDCLVSSRDGYAAKHDDLHLIHFDDLGADRTPDTLGDGIDLIESHLA
jgi:hypothetical protein